jgi:endonuclease/exonuclease/phosphatase family metal-dependent hydrolase
MPKKKTFPCAPGWFLLLVVLLWGTTPAAAEDFDLLVYNTHGLPSWIAGDDPETRFPIIGSHTERYDLTLLQEDFNHHEKLREGTGTALVKRGSPTRLPWCTFCSGDGLTTVSRLPADWQLEIENYTFATCSGWLTGANDCLATKGFQLLDLTTPGGARIFVVNTHMDAGEGESDREAREAQLETLRQVVQREVGDHALIVAGDLNLDASNPLDRALLEAFMQSLGLIDSGAHPTPPTNWEILDYILIRNGPKTRLVVRNSGEDLTLAQHGTPLSDHPALFARFTVESSKSNP